MQFSQFTRAEEGNVIRFYTPNPLKDVSNIKYYTDNATGPFAKKEFRWSFDSNYWSSWETLNQGNFSGIKIGNNTYLFLEIRYTSSGGSVTSFSMNFDGAAQTEYTGQSCPPDSTYVSPDQTVKDSYTPGSTPGSPGIIDADYLCGKSCDYYLWRPNHKGTQPISTITDLQSILNNLSTGIQNSITNGDNEPGSGFGVYSKKDDQTLYFKRIDASGTLSISEANGVITLSSDASGGGGSTTLEQLTDVSVGGKSIGQVLTWNGSYWVPEDVSGVSVSKEYVDGSLAARDASITFLFDWNYVLDASITDIYGRLDVIDASIADLYSKLDVSSGILVIENVGGGDASIFKGTTSGTAYFRTIDGSGIINVVNDGDVIIISADASMTVGVQGATNIGGGSGEIFSTIDSSKNLELRTIDGSGATTVITSGDKIIVSSELISDSSVKNIANIDSSGGLVLAEIDSSGTAQLRNIVGSGAIAVSTAGDSIVLYSDASITVDPCTWSDTDPISADVGGLVGGDTINPGTNSIQILEDILYEYFPPTGYVTIDPSPGPTSSTGYYEKYVADPFAQGAIYTYRYDNSDFSKLRIFDVSVYRNGVGYTKDSWGGTTDTGVRSIFDGSPPINTGLGAADQDLIINLEIENKVEGNTMTPYDVSTAALWTNPYFYGVVPETIDATNISNSDILGLNKLIVPEQSNQINYDVSANYEKIKFVYAYPSSYGDLRSIFDVKNDFNVTSSFDMTTLNVKMSGPLGPGPFITYKVYIKSHWISFTPDVSIFKLIFNI